MTGADDLAQRRTCRRFNADFVEVAPRSKIGIARNARPGEWPLNGLRHPPEGDRSGWYVWAGDDSLSSDPEFFEAVPVSRVPHLLPSILPYLGLPPGWRFLAAEDHEDVWYDPTLLQV